MPKRIRQGQRPDRYRILINKGSHQVKNYYAWQIAASPEFFFNGGGGKTHIWEKQYFFDIRYE